MKVITCITCPVGCEITAEEKNGRYLFRGALCKAGEKYAYMELTSPERVVTTSIRIKGSVMPLVSVKTSAPVPREKIRGILDEALKAEIVSPVKRGDVIISNICGTEADLIATRTQ
ncbi:MAG: DUF1667 domain-containing protein [Spirochaetia bacterium]|jgi:CxxC motif-containing protein|nr:DUF1667 domain-containing protein [Spirochaetia bacterium]